MVVLGWASGGVALVRYRESLAGADGHPRRPSGSPTTVNVLTSVAFCWFAVAFAVGVVV